MRLLLSVDSAGPALSRETLRAGAWHDGRADHEVHTPGAEPPCRPGRSSPPWRGL